MVWREHACCVSYDQVWLCCSGLRVTKAMGVGGVYGGEGVMDGYV